MKTPLEQAIERKTGLSIEEVRALTISQHRHRAEQRTGRPMQFGTNAPRLLSREQIEKMLDKALS